MSHSEGPVTQNHHGQGPSRFRRFILATLFSGVALGVLIIADRSHLKAVQSYQGILRGRQIAQQVSTLELHARDRGMSEPLKWAIETLDKASEPRTARLFLLAEGKPSQLTDLSRWESSGDKEPQGKLTYLKWLFPERGEGVRIELALGPSGFLGTAGKWASDSLKAICFAIFFLLHWFGYAYRHAKKSNSRRPSDASESNENTEAVSARVYKLIQDTKVSLLETGKQVRDLTKATQDLMNQFTPAAERLVEVRSKVQSQADLVAAGRKAVQESKENWGQLETSMTAVAIESGKAGETLISLSQNALKASERLRKSEAEIETAVLKLLEVQDPISSEIELSLKNFEKISKSKDRVAKEISQTLQSLIKQSENLEKLRVAVTAPPLKKASRVGKSAAKPEPGQAA